MVLELNIFLDKKLIRRAFIPKSRMTIGRSSTNDLVLFNEHVSRLHVVIRQEGDLFHLEDKSSNGVLINGTKVLGSATLPSQCRLEIYPFKIDCLCHQEAQTSPIGGKDDENASRPVRFEQDVLLKHSPIVKHFGTLIGESLAMQRIYHLIEEVADRPATVLVLGEHGTGKEGVAQALHEVSRRRDRPFIAINCAAIPIDLIESELFGYEKGAFTGAQVAKMGKVEEADGGTLFLDEIGELSPAAQAKLLRFLQEKKILRLGGALEIPVDVRVIAATNKNLEQAVQRGAFRPDLYYRIKVVQMTLPPLRERSEDIPLLTLHFLQKFSEELKLPALPMLTADAMCQLQNKRWPGNVRQLENFLYNALIQSHPPYVLDSQTLFHDSSQDEGSYPTDGVSHEEFPTAVTKQLLIQTLKEHHWNTAKVAEILRVSRGTVYYRLKKYGIEIREILKENSGRF